MKGSQEDCRGRDLGFHTGVGHRSGGGAEIENLIEIPGEGGKFVGCAILPFHKCKIATQFSAPLSFSSAQLFLPGLRRRRLSRSRRNSSRLIAEIFSK